MKDHDTTDEARTYIGEPADTLGTDHDLPHLLFHQRPFVEQVESSASTQSWSLRVEHIGDLKPATLGGGLDHGMVNEIETREVVSVNVVSEAGSQHAAFSLADLTSRGWGRSHATSTPSRQLQPLASTLLILAS